MILEIFCEELSPGMRPVDAIATIRDYHGRRHFLNVEKDFFGQHGNRYTMPVGFIHRDRETGAFLIELPQEAENGANRLWIRAEDVLNGAEVAT